MQMDKGDKSVLLEHLSKKTHKALRHLKDDSDWSEWLDLSLKVDCLIRLENEYGDSLRVGVHPTIAININSFWDKDGLAGILPSLPKSHECPFA